MRDSNVRLDPLGDKHMPSLCILTAYNSRYEEIAAISQPSMRQFADIYGYELAVIGRDDCVRRGGWIKIEPILEVLAGDFEFVLWLDADTMFARIDVDVRTVAEPDADLYMSWHCPPSGGDLPHYNSGVMLIRNSDWSRHFFEQVWKTGPLPHKWNDQAAILQALGYNAVLGLGDDHNDNPNRRNVMQISEAWVTVHTPAPVRRPRGLWAA